MLSHSWSELTLTRFPNHKKQSLDPLRPAYWKLKSLKINTSLLVYPLHIPKSYNPNKNQSHLKIDRLRKYMINEFLNMTVLVSSHSFNQMVSLAVGPTLIKIRIWDSHNWKRRLPWTGRMPIESTPLNSEFLCPDPDEVKHMTQWSWLS